MLKHKLEHRCWNTNAGNLCWNTVKVVIDGNRLLWNTRDAGTARCWKHTDAGTQMLEHRCWNTNAGNLCWNTVKVVIDGNRLVMEHAQEMLEHRS
jgi:hypothetical protein